MSTLALLDVTTHVGGHDFTTESNQANLTMEAVQLDATTFGSSGWTELKGGLKSSTFELAGYWQSGFASADEDQDSQSFINFGVRNRIHTLAPTGAEQESAYMWQAGHFNYQLLGAIGELAPFTLNSQGTDGVGVVRGQLAKAKGDVSATGALGSPVNLGAGSAGEFLYASFHAFIVGTTITIDVESAPTSAFVALDTVVRATIGPLTARGGTWIPRVDVSAVTHPWYRFNITAVTGTFSVAGAIGIQ